MNYPLISEYIEAIKSAEDNFKELTNLRPIIGYDGQPVMTSGNFAVVFKMEDKDTGKFYALKCFTKEQEGRDEAYHQIAEELKDVESPYIISIRYFDKELFVDTDQTTETEFPVLLMDWVEGTTLDRQLKYWVSSLHNAEEKHNAGECLFCFYELESIAYNFCCLARWLLVQPYAHGDLKPDNILVKQDESLVLVDYDGMFVPAMKGQKARELGSPNFCHPQRTEADFDEHIDDFSLVSILLSLKAISINPELLEKYGATDRLLFTEKDFFSIYESDIYNNLIKYDNDELGTVLSVFCLLCQHRISFKLPPFNKPCLELSSNEYNGIRCTNNLGNKIQNTNSSDKSVTINDVLLLDDFLVKNKLDYVLSGTVALMICGLLPEDYVPHDIDIQIIANPNKHKSISTLLEKIETYCGVKRPQYDDSDYSLYCFYIGDNNVSINAFVHIREFSTDEYIKVEIEDRIIKVSKVLNAFHYKYAMKRKKDYKFHFDLIKTMGNYL